MHTVKLLLILAVFSISFQANSQRYSETYNRFGLQAGISYGGINSENFLITPGSGFMAGLTTRANVYNNFLILYGVNFHQWNMSIEGSDPETSEIDFKATGVQLNLFVGHKIIGEHLSIEAGPVLQLNSKLEAGEEYQELYINGYNIQAKDLEDISRINFNLAGGISGGFSSFKVWLQYQYGVSNILKDLNSEELKNKDSRATDLKGHTGLATAGILMYF